MKKLVFVVALIGLVAAPALAAPQSTLVGRYQCTFSNGGTTYAAQPCRIATKKAKDGSGRTLWFEKSGGSQRLRGWVHPKEDGFEVDGQFYCPRGACTEAVQVRFIAKDAGFAGVFEHHQAGKMEVWMVRGK